MAAIIIWTGAFQGRWVAYRRRRDQPRDRPPEATCLRCKAATIDPGGGGWFYRRGEWRRCATALCPRCLEDLRWRESSG